jgi:hypothetical protein
MLVLMAPQRTKAVAAMDHFMGVFMEESGEIAV